MSPTDAKQRLIESIAHQFEGDVAEATAFINTQIARPRRIGKHGGIGGRWRK